MCAHGFAFSIGAEHDGPVVYSNYMINPQTGLPNYERLDDLRDADFDAHTWMRKPKRNATPVVEVLGLKKFNLRTQLRGARLQVTCVPHPEGAPLDAWKKILSGKD